MIAAVTLGVSDIDRAMTFYRQFMEALGWEEKFATRRSPPGPWAGWTPPGEAAPLFVISHPANPNLAVAPGDGPVVSFALASRRAVDAAHAEGLALGGSDAGAPGPAYPAPAYRACLRDPFGNRLCLVCLAPE